jgi:hypothetical protein
MEQLCWSIQEHTLQQETRDPQCFFYRGVNLKFTLQRHLYFYFLNNKNLFEVLELFETKQLPQQIHVAIKVEAEFASCICQNQIDSKKYC